MALQQNSVPARSLLCLTTLRPKLVQKKAVLFIFRQHFHVLPELMCLRRADGPDLLPLSQMQNLGITLELDPRGAKITRPAFGLYSSPVQQSTMGHIVLDLTSLAYQPKSHERSARPTKNAQELDDDDDKPLVRPDRSAVSEDEDEDDNLWCNLLTKKKRRSVNLLQDAEFLHRYEEEWTSIWRDPSATLEQDVSGTTRERSEDVPTLGKNSDGETLQKITNKLSDVRNLKDLHVKHYHVSSAQFKNRTTHLDIPGKVYDFYQHVVKTCPCCNSTKPRPDT